MIKRIGLHILFWGVILLWRANGDYLTKAPFEKFVYVNLMRLPIMMAATYTVIYYLLPKLVIEKKQYLKFALYLLITLWTATHIEMTLTKSNFMKLLLQPISSIYQYNVLTALHPYRNSFLLFAIIGIASQIRFFKLYLAQEKKEHQLIQEKLETQYSFLKAQVNPHFLFNALNNIYSMAVQKQQKDIALGLENLSGIMYYLTYESNAKLVSLKKEIDLLKNYMEIIQLRIEATDDTTISFNVEGGIANKEIAPVILLPLVENAFKHGIKPDQKCLVSIKLTIVKDTLQLNIKNTVFIYGDKELKEKGIGLANVKKRLDLKYAGNYTLSNKESDNYYYTDLRIDLSEKGDGESVVYYPLGK